MSQTTGSWRVAATAGILAMALGATGCSDGALKAGGEQPEQSGPVKIGMLLPTSGVYAPIAAEMKAGFELFLDENHGKLGGRDVDVIVEDTEATPEIGLRKAQKLLQEDDIDFGTGVVNSSVALQINSVFTEAQVPLVISNAFADEITGKARSQFVFRTAQSIHQFSYPVGQWIKDELGGPLYLIASDYVAGHGVADGVRAGFEDAGGTVVAESFPPFQQTEDYQPYLSKIKSSGAKTTFGFFAGGEAVNFVKQYQQFGLKDMIPLIGPGSTTGSDVIAAQGASAEGAYTVLPYAWTIDTPRNKQFVKAYKAKVGVEPSYYALFAYDAAQLIGLAIQNVKGDVSNGARLATAMEGAKIDSPRGSLTIDKKTHGTIQEMYVARIKMVNGELTPVILKDLGSFGEQPE